VQSAEPDLLTSLEEFVVAVLSSAHAEAADRLPESALTFSQAKVLLVVGAAAEPLPINVIADRAGVSVATAGRHTDRLVRRGLLSRDECSTDRRVKLIATAERGREVIAAHLEYRRDALRAFVRRLPEPVRAPLRDALRAALDSGAFATGTPTGTPTGTLTGGPIDSDTDRAVPSPRSATTVPGDLS